MRAVMLRWLRIGGFRHRKTRKNAGGWQQASRQRKLTDIVVCV
jgi:hypothetical protein